jgi:hypothetical protein
LPIEKFDENRECNVPKRKRGFLRGSTEGRRRAEKTILASLLCASKKVKYEVQDPRRGILLVPKEMKNFAKIDQIFLKGILTWERGRLACRRKLEG